MVRAGSGSNRTVQPFCHVPAAATCGLNVYMRGVCQQYLINLSKNGWQGNLHDMITQPGHVSKRSTGQQQVILQMPLLTPHCPTWHCTRAILPLLLQMSSSALPPAIHVLLRYNPGRAEVALGYMVHVCCCLARGYNPRQLLALHRGIGTPEDMAAFVDAAHGLGLGVMMDVVLHHGAPSGNMLWDWDGWQQGHNGGIYHEGAPDCMWGRCAAVLRLKPAARNMCWWQAWSELLHYVCCVLRCRGLQTVSSRAAVRRLCHSLLSWRRWCEQVHAAVCHERWVPGAWTCARQALHAVLCPVCSRGPWVFPHPTAPTVWGSRAPPLRAFHCVLDEGHGPLAHSGQECCERTARGCLAGTPYQTQPC